MSNRYPHPIRGVIYDNDGLLLDSEGLYARVHKQLTGMDLDWEFRRQLMGRTGPDACALIVEKYGLAESPLSYLARRDAELQKIFPEAKLFNGAVEVVKYAVDRGLPVALATSSNRGNFVTKIVNHTEFYSQFKSIICGDEVDKGKPNPEIFLKCMKALGLDDPKEVLVFEDAPIGVRAANNAGMAVVMVPDPDLDLVTALEEVDAHPTYIATSLREVDWNMFDLKGQQ
jgi:pseudouridine-5'-monophosphatase